MAIGWIIALSKPCKETYAAENLARQNVECYFPRIAETVSRGPRHNRMKLERVSPLFPRYLFIHVQHQWRFVLSTFGVAGVVMRGEEPLWCPRSVMQQMWERQDPEGLIHLPKLLPGVRINVMRGPFAGQSGIYEGMASQERTKVLLNFLNRKVPVLIAQDAVQIAA